MSDITKEHIAIFRQYFLSDDESINKKILESIPVALREQLLVIQNGFDNSTDARSIASDIHAPEFEKEIEEIQSEYYLKKFDLNDQELEKDITAAIKRIERETLKKKLIAFEEMGGIELSDTELKSAITQVERESLKEKLQTLDDSSKRKVIPINSILKYAVAACFVVTIGIGFYHYTRKEVIPENSVAISSDKKQPAQKLNIVPVIETEPLAAVSIASSSCVVLKSGLGFGEVEQKITVVENNQQGRILSIQKAISAYQIQLDKATEPRNPDSGQIVNELRKRISSLKDELQKLNARENQYIFDGKVLTLFIASASNGNQIILYDDIYYLQKNNKFFRLFISKDAKPLKLETDPTVLKSLDKIIYNAK